MHVLCYGAGAVGSLVGGRLSQSGAAEVTLLARRRHVAAIRTWGLILEVPDGRVVCKGADSVTSVDDLASPPDLVLLTVKAYQTADALADLGGLIRRGVPILSLQNGVGNEEAIAAAGARPIAGAITVSASMLRPGVVRQNTRGGGIALAAVRIDPGVGSTAAGGTDAERADLEAATALFRQAGFRTELFPDYRPVKWSKLLLNIVGNASAAILDLPPGVVVRDRRVFHLEREAFLEAVRVIRGLGLRPVALPGYPVPLLAKVMALPEWAGRPVLSRRIGRGRGEKMPSLWEDLERGRTQSEVEVLNGAVAREGARLGFPTPANALLARVLLALAGGTRDRAEFRRNPQALVAARDAIMLERVGP